MNLFHNWLHQRKKRVAARRDRCGGAGRRFACRPRLEALEDRVVLNNHTWIGSVSSNWSVASNWSGGAPQTDPSPDLFFPTGIAQTATNNDLTNLFVHSIHFTGSGSVSYTLSGNAFQLGFGGIAVDAGVSGTETVGNSITLVGPATLTATDVGATLTLNGNINNNGSLLSAFGSGPVNLNGSISGSGGLTKGGTMTLTLAGHASNSYTGVTVINDGTLLLDKTPFSILQTPPQAVVGPLQIGSGSLSVPSNGAIVRLAASNQIGDAASVSFAQSLGQTPLLNLNGFDDAVGPINFLASGVISTGAGTLTLTGDVLQNGGNNSFITGNLSLGSATRTFVIGTSGGVNVSANVSGATGVGMDKQGAGQLLLSGNNTFSGEARVFAGTLTAGSNTALGTASGSLSDATIVFNNAAISVLNAHVGNEFLEMGGGTTAGNATLQGAGTAAWDGFISLTSPTIVTVGANSTLTLNGIVGSTSSADTLTKQGSGTVALTNNNSYSSLTSVAAGTLSVRNAGALGDPSQGTTVNSGATLEVRGGLTLAEPLTLNGAGVNNIGALHDVADDNTWSGAITLGSLTRIDVDGGHQLTISGPIHGPASAGLVKIGLGKLVLSGSNDYAGPTTVSAGTLRLTSNTALGAADGTAMTGTTVNPGAALELAGGIAPFNEFLTLFGSGVSGGGALRNIAGTNFWAGSISLPQAAFIGADAGQLDITGGISGAGSLTKVGTAPVVFGGVLANTYQGGTIVKAGQLLLAKSAGVNAVPGILTIGDNTSPAGTANVVSQADDQIPSPVFINNSGVLNLNGHTDTIPGITMTGGLVQTGTGTLIMNGAIASNAFGSPAVINGKISLRGIVDAFDIADGSADQDMIINATILDGFVAKDLSGTLVLSANNSNAGIEVLAGTVRANGFDPNTVVNLSSGALFGGTGTVKSIPQIPAGSVIDPGAGLGQAGVLNVGAPGATFSANSTFNVDLNGTAPGSFDELNVGGPVNLGSAILTGALHFHSSQNDVFDILHAAGGLVGTFATASPLKLPDPTSPDPNNPVIYDFGISYTSTDVVLTNLGVDAQFIGRQVTTPITEGGIATLTGTIVDTDPQGTFILQVKWGDGTPTQTFTFPPSASRTVSLPHQYVQNGQYTVHVQWQDSNGPAKSDDLALTVLNVAPVVDAGSDVHLHPGGVLERQGSFSDPGADSWTATVDFGDGSGPQQLKLEPDKKFHLHHKYPAAGTFLVTVTVRDSDGGVGIDQFVATIGD
jgi:autotransporter-associated beta strand protein